MKKLLPYLKNKFIVASTIFLVYILFLDEYDIFTIVQQQRRLVQLEASKAEVEKNLAETKTTLETLTTRTEVERYAREKKFFKKDDEDIFVIFYE